MVYNAYIGVQTLCRDTDIYTAVLPYKHVVTIQQFYHTSPCITSQHKHSSCTTHCNSSQRYTEAVTHIITQNTAAVTHIALQHTLEHTTHIAQHTTHIATHNTHHNKQHMSHRNTHRVTAHHTHRVATHNTRRVTTHHTHQISTHNTHRITTHHTHRVATHIASHTLRRNTQNSSMTQNTVVLPHIVTHRQATFGLAMLHQATSQHNR